MSKLANLKRNRLKNMKKLQEKIASQGSSDYPTDERIWRPKFNKEKGKGVCIVRLLPAKEGSPFIELKSYSFRGPGGYFWENALQTIGKEDPVQIAAINAFRKAKADGDNKLREYAKKFLPRSQYYANVYVVRDEEAPENEGQVKIYQFGRQIFNIIQSAIKPEYDDVDPMDPFDLWEGADLRIRMKGNRIPDQRNPGQTVLVPSYEDSSFDDATAFMEADEEVLEKIYLQTHNLDEFVSEDKFKSFEDQAAQFQKVTGKPYNWLTAEGVEQHVEEQEQQRELDSSVDEGSLSRDDEEEVDSTPQADSSGEGLSAIERFKQLASQS